MDTHVTRHAAIGRVAILLLFSASAYCGAQSAATPSPNSPPLAAPALDATPAFDVAVVRPNPGDTTGHSHIWSAATDGHFKAQNVTAMLLIQYAYALPENRIVGGPGWTRSAKWDAEAKPDPSLDERLRRLESGEARQVKRRMLQELLADRFGLKAHEETRILPVYALGLAKGGPKFQPSQINGTTIMNSNGQISVAGSDHTVALLAEQLGKMLGRVVVDKTGLDGRFELTLKWTPDDFDSRGVGSADGPSLFTAIQEQLGLRLESQKAPVSVLVIDRIETPSPN